MPYRFDMREKSAQQQAIVRQRDENERIKKSLILFNCIKTL
ncbi:hypothetical protein [Brassicibacter mesophilus]